MLRRRQINSGTRGRGTRLPLAAAEAVRWPFERAVWSFERRLIWPLQRRLAGRGSAARGAGVGALAALAAGAVLVAVLVLPGGDAVPEHATEPARVAIVTADPQPHDERQQAPSLQGVPPHFGVGTGVGVSRADRGEVETGEAETASSATDPTASAATPPAEGGATASASDAKEAVPAGPAAMMVARRFSEAFVFYEIGERPARAKTVFGETATPQLAEALDERPPRLPSNAKVPKAKVLNLVPGPRFGKDYTVSVSLLRVGVTSELRLTLQEEKDGGWSVAQILG